MMGDAKFVLKTPDGTILKGLVHSYSITNRHSPIMSLGSLRPEKYEPVKEDVEIRGVIISSIFPENEELKKKNFEKRFGKEEDEWSFMEELKNM